MSTHHVSLRQQFAAPAERVFAALSDHPNMGRWLGVRVDAPTMTPGGGVGSIRHVHAGPLTIVEEVVTHEPPHRLVYRIVRGVPFVTHHEGVVWVDAEGPAACTVRWEVSMSASVPGFARLMLGAVKGSLGRGLSRLARELAA